MIDTITLQAKHRYNEYSELQAYKDSLPIDLRDVGSTMPIYKGRMALTKGCTTLQVTITPYTIKVNGSICKATYGNNFITMPHSRIIEVLLQIADTFGIPLHEWNITRLDVAANLIMAKPPKNYYDRFGTLAYYEQTPITTMGVYYQQKHREVNVYDKTEEAARKRERIPAEYCDLNVLRIEHRAKRGQRNVMQAYKQSEPINAAMLCNVDYYANIIVYGFMKLILSINFINDMEINLNHLTTLKEVDRMGRAALIEKAGGIANMLRVIDRRRAEGAITKKQASDLRRTFKAIAQHDAILLPNEDAAELQAKITNASNEILP